MNNDLTDIKKRILEEDRLKEILNLMECEEVKFKNNRFEAMLPPKFNSDSTRSVQAYQNENISCRIRTRSVSNIDIFDLISYIVFDCYDDNSIHKCLPKSKRWLCEKLGYDEYLNGFARTEPKKDHLRWLHDLKRKRSKQKHQIKENEIFDDSILSQFVMYPHVKYLDEGIEYKTQLEFQIGFDIQSERLIYPIHNQFGEIISVKGRTLELEYELKNIPKFLYLIPFNMMYEWYNWHRAMYYIIEAKEVIIYEAEKTSWLSTQFGIRNCLSIGGGDISEFQVQLIKSLGMEIKIVLAYDKDKTAEDIKKQAKKFGNTRSVFAMWDGRKVFSADEKHSPTDLGEEAFKQLYEDRHQYRII
ncbi:DNA primase [Paenibacillus ferrarius]|uniref:DNA primase n=1 Tax=Paenibacillus ferrarius TaxID=1469647 RepID=A0A1V4HSQ9_9BACL|nr:DNA primase [Paenibacillus ferrarius]OPH61862.1 DNA primase [Paenibacillus ferrarius]